MVSVAYNSNENAWTYQIKMVNNIGTKVAITGIYGKVVSQTKQIAPPFGDSIGITGGEKTSSELVVMPGQTAVLQVTSKDPLWLITLVENGSIRCQIPFWR
jgi:hypothetical protein